jgi:hypothetical protein
VNSEHWHLYSSFEKKIMKNISLLALDKNIRNIPIVDYAKWFVCRSSEKEWSPLLDKVSEISKLVGQVNDLKVVGLDEYIADAIRTVVTAQSSSPDSITNDNEKRGARRVQVKLSMLIDARTTILSATSVDLSLLAVKLDKRFPMEYRDRSLALVISVEFPR